VPRQRQAQKGPIRNRQQDNDRRQNKHADAGAPAGSQRRSAPARNMLGFEERFDAVVFFWSQHYDVPINYVGHAEQWDEIAVDGSVAGKDCVLRYKSKGRVLAVASIYRDLESLKAELAMERGTVP
jgi:hypothetical protein